MDAWICTPGPIDAQPAGSTKVSDHISHMLPRGHMSEKWHISLTRLTQREIIERISFPDIEDLSANKRLQHMTGKTLSNN
jgi:hypothetical protein